jgi:hypothetical protein
MEKSSATTPKKHWYYIAWLAVFGVIVVGGMAEANIAEGKYNFILYSVCLLSAILAVYSIIKYKFGSLVELILFLPGGGGGFDE